MVAAAGDDVITGTEEDDFIEGWSGSDYITGAAGNDRIWGNTGSDFLYGGADNDILVGNDWAPGGFSMLWAQCWGGAGDLGGGGDSDCGVVRLGERSAEFDGWFVPGGEGRLFAEGFGEAFEVAEERVVGGAPAGVFADAAEFSEGGLGDAAVLGEARGCV
jgi:hypothetical protein